MTFQECPECGHDEMDVNTPNGEDGYHAFDFLNLETGEIEAVVSCLNCEWEREFSL